jgi:hypothetical protein
MQVSNRSTVGVLVWLAVISLAIETTCLQAYSLNEVLTSLQVVDTGSSLDDHTSTVAAWCTRVARVHAQHI